MELINFLDKELRKLQKDQRDQLGGIKKYLV